MKKTRIFVALATVLGLAAAAPFLLGAAVASQSRTAAGTPPPPPKPKQVAVPKSAPTAGPTFICGEVATKSVTLTADENCPGANGIVAGANGVVINLNGHTLTGDGTHFGVYNPSFTGVTITNGVIIDFQWAVVADGGTNHITSVNALNNTDGGIYIQGDGDVVSGDRVTGNVFGIYVDGGQNVQVTGNWVAGNASVGVYLLAVTGLAASKNTSIDQTGSGDGYGFVAAEDTGSLTGNVANGNAIDGFYLNSGGSGVKPGLTVTGNRAAFNAALGFDGPESGALDGGGNVVQGNTTATQCLVIVCHAVSN